MGILSKNGKAVKLDAKGWKIISQLIKNPRANLNEISKNIGLNRNSIEYRIKQLKEKGLITGCKTIINTQKLGYKKYHIFFTINTSQHENEFIEKLKESKYVNTIISYKGKYNYEISIMINDETKLLDIYYLLIKDTSISSEEILLLTKNIKSEVLPTKFFKKEVNNGKYIRNGKEEKYNPDINDIKIMRILSNEGDLSNVEIGNRIGISHDTVRYKIKKLIASNYITEFRPAIDYSRLNLSMQTILLKLNYKYYNKHTELDLFLKENQNVIWATKSFGKYDYVIYILCENSNELIQFFDEIKDKFGPIFKTYDLLLVDKQHKYSYMTDLVFDGME